MPRLENYDANITLVQRAAVQNRAKAVGGICGTITAIEILNHFGVYIPDKEIKEGIRDDMERGTNQVNMALFMSKYLNVTFCVNHDIRKEIEKGDKCTTIPLQDIPEFKKLLDTDIHFEITPTLEDIVMMLNKEEALAQFVFLETGHTMTHYGLLCKVENDMLEFTQRTDQLGVPDVAVHDFESWWDLRGGQMDPEKLVLIYRQKQHNN